MTNGERRKIEFKPWPKISRLYRDVIISEKIDGTNAAVGIVPLESLKRTSDDTLDDIMESNPEILGMVWQAGRVETWEGFAVYAQSRKLIITPDRDNAGFATWVRSKAFELVSALGPGLHYGEWWGSGIQRGYDLLKGDKRFSLFNVTRHRTTDFSEHGLDNVSTVPVMYEGPFTTNAVDHQLAVLEYSGSVAAPGYMNPEGVVTFHTHANVAFKTTLKNDEKSKSDLGRASVFVSGGVYGDSRVVMSDGR